MGVEDHVFEDRKGALDGASSQPHGFHGGSEIHFVQGTLVDVPLHQPARGARAFRFQSAFATSIGFSSVDHAAFTLQNLFAI